MDNIILNKIMPRLASTYKVAPLGQRQGTNHNNLFKDTSRQKKKKKNKEDPTGMRMSDRSNTTAESSITRHGKKKYDSNLSPNQRIIDIRV